MPHEITAAASGCLVMSRAQAVAAWVGEERPVTASGVLRRADARDMANALGIPLPGHVRSAADVPAVHRPWIVAQAAGMLTVGQGRAAGAPSAPALTPELWFAGLEAVCRAESHDRLEHGAAIACRHLLTVLATEPPPDADDLEDAVHQLLDAADGDIHPVFQAFRRGLMPVEAALELLAEFGAVDQIQAITPLGRWALGRFRERLPAPITSDLPAGEVLTRLSRLPAEDAWYQAWRWLEGRRVDEVAGLLLTAAVGASPTERITAVNLVARLGDEALPTWRRAFRHPVLAAHARAELAGWDETPALRENDQQWLTTEYALAAIEKGDLHDAWHTVHEGGGLKAVEAGGHPGAAELARALLAYTAAGGGQPRVHQLKISITRMRPPVWRRIQVPDHATLADLHHIIKIIFDWSDAHLHVFTAGGARYSDPFFDLEECSDEAHIRLVKVLPQPGSKITYRYDLGDCWDHEITLEKTLDPDDALTYPVCVTGRGNAPVEDWNPEYPEDPVPFDIDDLNQRLSELT
jgi:hypothetical protein